jgi:hypothetical protein
LIWLGWWAEVDDHIGIATPSEAIESLCQVVGCVAELFYPVGNSMDLKNSEQVVAIS